MGINSLFISEGATKPDSLAVDSYEQLLSAARVMPLPSTQQTLIDYNGGTNPIYIGTAPQGYAEGAGTDNDPTQLNWMIKKVTWDGNNNPTSVQTAWGTWTNHASLTYS
jgi:hypothetical protein